MKPGFRILKDWNIRITKSSKYAGFCNVNVKEKVAIIYDETPRPPNFITHELLHCCLRALLSMDKRKWRGLMTTEEELIQDICGTFGVNDKDWEALRGEEQYEKILHHPH